MQKPYYMLSSSFSTIAIALFSDAPIITYTFISPFNHSFRLYANVYIASSVAKLGSTTTILLNQVAYSLIDLHCQNSYNLSQAVFLSSNSAYKPGNIYSNLSNIICAFLHTSDWSIYSAALLSTEEMQYLHNWTMLLPIHGIWAGINYHECW